ncbi:cation transporter [Liquorilactobacillus satsumensis]|uniref:cation transporter n=1 Tax=Liquorilactobacillus satsumensis TaxID=259059 RepID=UPI0039EA564E
MQVKTSYSKLLQKSLRTEYFSVGWMFFEFLVALYSGIRAGSILLIAFGLDSLLEIIAGLTLIWRLHKAEVAGMTESDIKIAERRSSIVVGSVLLLLGIYIFSISIYDLTAQQGAQDSLMGIGLAVSAVFLMPFLVHKKRSLGKALHSKALIEDGMCNITCAYMAATVLIGTLFTALFNWWWLDATAALFLCYFIMNEGREALHEGLAQEKKDE